MEKVLAIFVFLASILISCGFLISHGRRNSLKYSGSLSLPATVQPSAAINEEQAVRAMLGNSNLAVSFSGFGDIDATCVISLSKRGEVDFSDGLAALQKGMWKIYKAKPTDELWTVEAVHFVRPEYMLFFDIWENFLVWQGKLDVSKLKVIDGKVLNKKKRLGLFPYVDTIATFSADIYTAGQEPPRAVLPSASSLVFEPPEGFEDPGDMVKFPHIFAPDFVEWWFAVEDATARGQPAPPRPKSVFLPRPGATPENPWGTSPEPEDRPLKGKSRKSTSANKKGFE
eukprot:gene1907-2085_t